MLYWYTYLIRAFLFVFVLFCFYLNIFVSRFILSHHFGKNKFVEVSAINVLANASIVISPSTPQVILTKAKGKGLWNLSANQIIFLTDNKKRVTSTEPITAYCWKQTFCSQKKKCSILIKLHDIQLPLLNQGRRFYSQRYPFLKYLRFGTITSFEN